MMAMKTNDYCEPAHCNVCPPQYQYLQFECGVGTWRRNESPGAKRIRGLGKTFAMR